jgi:midasin
MVVLDGLGSLPQTQGWSPVLLSDLRQRATSMLASLTPPTPSTLRDSVILEADAMAIGPFKIKRGTNPPVAQKFAFRAPTTLENARRVLRACQLNKAILLEGSPGVGKTSLVSALASFSCQTLCRVNLSDQTDLIDLFGSDLPLEGGAAGEFVWRDAAFLQALQNGHWVLLDEMNLAPQSVLEGLNAILDHRGTVFLPELGRSFTKHPDFRLFAAQNPVQQGGGRKGLPKSFLNRFTKVYMEELNSDDLLIISKNLHPGHSEDELQQMIDFNSRVHHEATIRRSMGRQGSPWEFNLRDITRWLALRESASPLELDPGNPTEYMDEIYSQRFRTPVDRLDLHLVEKKVFSRPHDPIEGVHVSFFARYAQFGHSLIERKPASQQPAYLSPFSHAHFKAFQAMAKCVNEGWLIILVGHAAAGKTTILRQFAALHGEHIATLSATSATDASDLLGGFEQEQEMLMGQKVVSGELQEPMAVDGVPRPVDYANGVDSYHTALTSFIDKHKTVSADTQTESGKAKKFKGRFVWVDGPLVRALKDGTWFILDNANLCNPSVLDRLNSLCEPGGALTLTERGLVGGEPQVLRPHPNFRLFMAMDPANGELSRAMRNRGIEIYIDTVLRTEDDATMKIDSSASESTTAPSSERLDALCHHLSSRSMRHLILLLSKFEKFSLEAQLQFLLRRLSRPACFLFLRLKGFSRLRSALSAFLGSHATILEFLTLVADQLALPQGFLGAEVCLL